MCVKYIFVPFSMFPHSWAVSAIGLLPPWHGWQRLKQQQEQQQQSIFKATQKPRLQLNILLSVALCIVQCIWKRV